MKTLRLFSLAWIVLFGAIMGLSSPAYSDAPPRLDDVRELLEKAWSPDVDTPPSTADRVDLLKQAMKLLKAAPYNYHGFKVKTMEYIDSALYEFNRGDPDHKAIDYIHSAVTEIRNIT